MTSSKVEACRKKALDLLARRPHFRAELANKLELRGFSSLDVDSVLEELTGQGLLDDLMHASAWANGALSRRGLGPRGMESELRRRGVGDSIVEQVLADVYPSRAVEIQRALEVVERWRSSGRAGREKLARHLDRKGFSPGVILTVIDEPLES